MPRASLEIALQGLILPPRCFNLSTNIEVELVGDFTVSIEGEMEAKVETAMAVPVHSGVLSVALEDTLDVKLDTC